MTLAERLSDWKALAGAGAAGEMPKGGQHSANRKSGVHAFIAKC